MGKYKIALTDRAQTHLSEWKKSGQLIALKKIERILLELSDTPFTVSPCLCVKFLLLCYFVTSI